MKAASFKHQPLFVLALCCLCVVNIQAQQKTIPLCDEERAVLLAEKQVEEISMLDQPQKQIAVMIRAADVLWKAQQSTARKIFSEAFALAEKVFKEKGDETKRDGKMTIQIPDQRFVVMRAIAKRDAIWAKQLALRLAEETKKQAEQAAGNATTPARELYREGVQDKILNLAIATAPTDKTIASSLIRSTFAYPFSRTLPRALYAVAEINQAEGDQLYQDALKNYANAPINELLFLSAYPFARDRIIGAEMYMNGWAQPKNVQPNSALQQLFIETLLHRAEAILKMPEPQINGVYKLPEASQLVFAFNHLEAIAAQFQPAFVNRIVETKAYLNASLNNDMRQTLDGVSRQHEEMNLQMSGKGDAFARYSEQAEHETNPTKREQALAFAVMNASEEKTIGDLISAARKVDDEKLRNQLLTFIYFKRTQKAIRDGQFFEALQLAKNIEQLDFRAYLAYEMAAAAFKKEEEKPRIKEILEDVLELAYRAPSTTEKARTLLGVVHMYAKLDKTRALEVMSEAVKTINKIDSADFSQNFINLKIEGKQFNTHYGFQVEGFSLEAVFRLLAPIDFDGALWRATGLEDKSLRGLAVLSLVASCLEENERMKKQEAEKYNKAKESAGRPDAKEAKKLQDKKPLQR